jgi:ankyrin repeat protein
VPVNYEQSDAYVLFMTIAHANIVSYMIFFILDTEGRTPLHWAVDRGHLSAVEILAKANADLNAKVYWNYLYTFCIL